MITYRTFIKRKSIFLFLLLLFCLHDSHARTQESIFQDAPNVLHEIYPNGYTPIRVKLTLPKKEIYTLKSEIPFRVSV